MEKKENQLNILKKILFKSDFVIIFGTTNINIQDRKGLNKYLLDYGLKSKTLKNKIFNKSIEYNLPQFFEIKSLLQGTCMLVYGDSSNLHKEYSMQRLQHFLKDIKKNQKLIPLGGIFEGKLINRSFLDEIRSVDKTDVSLSECLNYIHTIQTKVINSIDNKAQELTYILKSRD